MKELLVEALCASHPELDICRTGSQRKWQGSGSWPALTLICSMQVHSSRRHRSYPEAQCALGGSGVWSPLCLLLPTVFFLGAAILSPPSPG